MNTNDDLAMMISKAFEEDLRELVVEWSATHSDFKAFVAHKLCPHPDEEDFDGKLNKSIIRETKKFFSSHTVRVATD